MIGNKKIFVYTHFDDGLLIHERKWVIDFSPLEKAVWRVKEKSSIGCSSSSREYRIKYIFIIDYQDYERGEQQQKQQLLGMLSNYWSFSDNF